MGSRSNTRKRRVENEPELEERLQSNGFRIVHCENISFRDQVGIFSGAKFIVGLHGAGLSNMVWADPPCKVLEIFPHGFFNDCYARLALTLSFEYEYVECAPGSGRIPIDIVTGKIKQIAQRIR